MARTPQEQEAFEREEQRKASQQQFDVAKHGVGTMPINAPQSVKELYAWTQKEIDLLHERVDSIIRAARGDENAQKLLAPSHGTGIVK
jgi:hypothetical protein